MRTHLASVWICMVSALACAGSVFAQQDDAVRKQHPWAAFSPGAWKTVRAVTETFDAEGKVASTGVTETKTTLTKVEDNAVTLELEVAVLIAGRLLDPKPQTIKQGFHGESDGEKVTIKELEPGEIVIEGRSIPCRVQQVELTDPGNKWIRTIKTYYSNDVAPFVLKCESVTKEPGKDAVLSRTTMMVDALRMPCEVADRLASVAHSRTIVEDERGVTITLAYASSDVPGGIVRQCSKEEDKEGRLVRRTVLEMTDFSLQPESQDRGGLFRRRSRPARGRFGTRGIGE